MRKTQVPMPFIDYKIETARVMTPEEKKSFFTYLHQKGEGEKKRTQEYFYQNRQIIADAYKEIEQKAIVQYDKHMQNLERRLSCIKTRTCWRCGQRLIYQPDWDAWECPRYEHVGDYWYDRHSIIYPYTEKQLQNKKRYLHPNIDRQWIKELKDKIKAPDYVKSQKLLELLIAEGFEDLRLKHGHKKTYQNLGNGWKRGRDREQEIGETLKQKFPKVIDQLGVKYKLKSQPEKTKFIDFIVSDNQNIYVIECKTGNWALNFEQLHLYASLIKHLEQRRHTDKPRLVHAVYIVYEQRKPEAFESTRKYDGMGYLTYRDEILPNDADQILRLIKNKNYLLSRR